MKFIDCDDCHGKGEITGYAGNIGGGEPAYVQTWTCPTCNGEGEIKSDNNN